MKAIHPLSPNEQQTLEEAYRHHPSHRLRQRAWGLLLSHRGYLAIRLSELFEVRQETVSAWFESWERLGVVGLLDQPRSGRPAIFSAQEQEQFLQYLAENPHQTKVVAARLQAETGKSASPFAFTRLLKKRGIGGSAAVSR